MAMLAHRHVIFDANADPLPALCDGRLIFGIGGGWNAEEMENHGTNFKRRWSILRERIANFEAPPKTPEAGGAVVAGISINDLRKNLRDLNERMDEECSSSAARYGVVLDASLITAIDPPQEVESALAAINTAYNEVSSEISVAQATADQTIVQSRRAVEIQTLRAQAEVEPLVALADQIAALRQSGGAEAVDAYRRYVRLGLLESASRIIKEVA